MVGQRLDSSADISNEDGFLGKVILQISLIAGGSCKEEQEGEKKSFLYPW